VPAFSFVGGGDIALVGRGASSSTFAGIHRFLRADLVMANLEGTLAADGSAKCAPYGSNGCYTFRAAPSSALVLRRAGFDVLNVANNHALDYGVQAQLETLAALRAAHIAYDGLPHQITVVKAGAVKVALIGCAPYPWAQSLLRIPATQALVRRAKTRADVVIVYMHAGAEGVAADHVTGRPEVFLGEQRGNPEAFAHAMINAGASLVFASGPHTLRGLQWYHGHVIAYSLGNLAGQDTLNMSGPTMSLSALLTLKLAATGRFVGGRVVPLRMVSPGTPTYDPTNGAIRFLNTLSREDFGASAVRLGPTGTILPQAR
jgi:poly-gamma-glutamate capsule biosynthesis protein CapA/YwtB (metallophosphatase superfamily)